MNIFKIALIAGAFALLLPASSVAQFTPSNPDGVPMPSIEDATKNRVGGPVAIGQAVAQVDPNGKVAIIQAPAVPATEGGIIQLSAFGWLAPYIDSAVQTLIVVALGWFGKTKYGQMLDQSSRDALEVFLKNRASSLLADGAVRIQDKSVKVDSTLLFRAANEASTAIPDALKRFGLTPDIISQKIIDAIPQTPAGAQIISEAHAQSGAPVAITDRGEAAPAAS